MLQLAWSEVRARASLFARRWSAESSESAGKQSFWNEFFAVFGRERRTVASFEVAVRGIRGEYKYIDLLWSGVLLVEHKSKGRSLAAAESQAFAYIEDLARTGRVNEIPRYVIISDFAQIALYDLEPSPESDLGDQGGMPFKQLTFPLSELPRHVRAFGFLNGVAQRRLDPDDPANERAYSLMCDLHDELEALGFRGTDLEKFLVRVLFCLFADDIGIFEPGTFESFVRDSTREDGSDVGALLNELFDALNTPEANWTESARDRFAGFRYVNGELFQDRLGFPQFNSSTRNALLGACAFHWARVSPAVFGSLFQGILEPKQRRQRGAHYTSERDILRVLHPLFIDSLRTELQSIRSDARAGHRLGRLRDFQTRLRALQFLDPACGCGNFLVLAYRELRELEHEVISEIHRNQQFLDIRMASLVDVDQFCGIEIEEWPARIATVALWLMDHQLNQKLSDMLGEHFERLPLRTSPKIIQANALTTSWTDLLKPSNQVMVFGNPPFVGKKEQTAKQKEDLNQVWGRIPGSGVLDYVTAWYRLAVDYIGSTGARVAFVSTNSITQGEQAAVLWPSLFALKQLHIQFAHRTFPWKSEARGAAHVHVVIIGFGRDDLQPKRIYDYDVDSELPEIVECASIGPYLTPGDNTTVRNRTSPLCEVPPIRYGSMMIDKPRGAGPEVGLVFESSQRDELLRDSPQLGPWVRPLIGGEEFLNSTHRWCLWLKGATPELLRSSPVLQARLEGVRSFRSSSSRPQTKALAATPYLFGEDRQPNTPYLFIPKVSSERRRYLPIGFIDPGTVASGSGLIVPEASIYHFGVLSSAMHNAWIRSVAGRMKSDLQYSGNIVYNNFPWPVGASDRATTTVINAAERVLGVRQRFLPPKGRSTLADLYDPLTMPQDLLEAHRRLDRAVELCYGAGSFKNDRERSQFLLKLFAQMDSPLTGGTSPKGRRNQKRSVEATEEVAEDEALPDPHDSFESAADSALPQWYLRLASGHPDSSMRGDLRSGALDELFLRVDELLESNGPEACNQLLATISAEAESSPISLLVGLLTVTLPYAELLPQRKELRRITSARLAAAGKSASRILKGL